MQPKTSFCLLVAVFVMALALPLSLAGEEPPKRSDGDQEGGQTTSEADVARELSGLKEKVSRLERKIDRLLEQPSEFSRVEIRIVDEQGRSMSDFEVELTSADEAQRARASGVSNDEGIALTRHLPYGAYWMNVSGNGWHTRDQVTVEVGQPLELTVVTPTPDQHGKLVLKSSLPAECVKGVRFGGYQVEQRDGGWATLLAPEPQGQPQDLAVEEQSSNGWKTFPTVSEGIDTVAVIVRFNSKRRTEQPDGSQTTWEWHPDSADRQPPHLQWLVQSDSTLRPVLKRAEEQKQITSQAAWFGAVASSDENEKEESTGFWQEKRLGYYDLELGEEHRGATTIELPAGQIELSIEGLYGRPSHEVLHAIDEPAESTSGQLWLRAVVKGDSEWLRRVLGRSMTVSSGQFPGGFSKTVNLSADETQTFNVGAGK